MSLIHCPECGHEVSTNAVSCPNCGRVLAAAPPPVERQTVVMPGRPVVRERAFPTWAYVPIALLGVLLIFLFILFLRSDNADETANININARRVPSAANDRTTETRTTTVPPAGGQSVTLPPDQTTTTTTTVPGTTTSVPVAPPPDKGTVVIRAQIVPSRGGSQPARNVKFYLLDRDIESILSQADIEPIEGNTLTASLGLAAVFPDRYGDFQRKAMRAIASHVKFSGSTGADGGASLNGIAPKDYYLFGITKVGRGFAMWNSPVSVIAGENVLNLSPQPLTEIPDSTG